MKKNNMFHLMENSPWPITISMNSNNMFMAIIKIIKSKDMQTNLMSLMILIMSSTIWWNNINRESKEKGKHTLTMNTLLKTSMALFISSELMLFATMFWNFYHLSFDAHVAMFGNWPPNSFNFTNPFMMPIYGTILLISSSMTASKAHLTMSKENNNLKKSSKNITKSILMGMMFLDMQIMEYTQSNSALTSMSQNPFSSIFFMTTGLHGSHVLLGVMFLMFIQNMMNQKEMSMKKHTSAIMAIWYWHFVDIMWLFVYYNLYFITAY